MKKQKILPKLVPVTETYKIIQFKGSNPQIKAAIISIKDNMKKGNVQDARIILETLRDDIEVNRIAVPRETYPLSLELTKKYVEKGRYDIAAENLIKEAKKNSKSNKKESLKHLELERGRLLGYLSKNKEMKILIKDIKNKLKGNKDTFKFLLEKINDFKNKL